MGSLVTALASAVELAGRGSGRRRATAVAALLALILALTTLVPRAVQSSEGAQSHALALAMGALSVPVLSRDKALFQAYVEVALALGDADERKSVQARMPRLRDAFFTSLYRLGAEGQLETGAFDLDQLKRIFQRAADRILGRGAVEVLILQAHLSRRQGATGRAPPAG
jgi:flagellar basal body-associated protein FliL